MKIQIINPNASLTMTEEIGHAARRVAAQGTHILLTGTASGPASIESAFDEALALPGLMQAVEQGRREGVHAHVVACFGDPGLQAAREMLPIPVVGLTEAALMSAAMLGGRFSIVAISRRIRAWYHETVELHGLGARLASIRCLDESLADIGTVQTDQAAQLLALCEAAVMHDGADVIIIAGAPLAGLARTLAERIPVPLVDGVSSAVRHAETLVALAPRAATSGSYAPPPQKDWKGLSPALGRLIGRN